MSAAAGPPLLNPYESAFRALEPLDAPTRLLARKPLIWAFAWAVPNRAAIEALASRKRIVEIGAGTGYWAWLLRQAGADILAYDLEPNQPPRWTEVESGDSSLAASHPDRTLLLCWPPLDDLMAEKTLKQFTGDSLAYVGEHRGRMATPGFFDALERDFKPVETIEIPRWPGHEDRLRLYERLG